MVHLREEGREERREGEGREGRERKGGRERRKGGRERRKGGRSDACGRDWEALRMMEKVEGVTVECSFAGVVKFEPEISATMR